MTRRLPRSTPGAEGVSARGLLAFLDSVGGGGDGPELHSLMVLRHGRVVAEGWWAPYAADLQHEMYSLSKSFTSTAVGFAVAEGRLSVDDLVLDHVGDAAPEQVDPHLARMRVRHLLTMTTGHEGPTDGVFGTRSWDRAFLRLPVEHEPGTHFLYNTAASYLLSSIVQRRTGQRLLDYLRPRLLEPLGIEDPRWERSPKGVDVGGWGMSLRTEDIACFGQLYLDDGVWQGRRVLPEGWAREATAYQVPSVFGETDWRQGYGYQFWRCRHGAYRGDGAFGQFCVVLPEQQAVVVTTSGTPDLQGVLDRVWEHLLPAFGDLDPAGVDAAAEAELADRLGNLRLDPPAPTGVAPADRYAGRTIELPHGPALGIRSLTVGATGLGADDATVTIRTADGTSTLPVGHGEWALGVLRLWTRDGSLQNGDDMPDQPVAAAGAWLDPSTYELHLRLRQTPYRAALTLRFPAGGAAVGAPVGVAVRLNVSFGPTELGEVTGVLR